MVVLRAFGPADGRISLIRNAISFPEFLVKINGEQAGFFSSSQGFQHGDSLSPLLFILSEEPLSRGLLNLLREEKKSPYQVPKNCLPVSHMSYADDSQVFANGSWGSLKLLMEFLHSYEKVFG